MVGEYKDLRNAVERAGFHTTFMPIEEVGDRIVCASHRYPEGHERRGLYGNSFWVAKRGTNWFIATWAPRIYRLAKPERLSELCLNLLGRQGGGCWDIDAATRNSYGLTEVSDDEFGTTAAG